MLKPQLKCRINNSNHSVPMIAYIYQYLEWNTLKGFALGKYLYFLFYGTFDFYKFLSEIPHLKKTC